MTQDLTSTTWVLTDWYGSASTDDLKPTFAARTITELKRCLCAFRDMQPRVVHVEGVAGLMIRIGIGGPFGHVYVTSVGSRHQAWLAVAPRIIATDDVTFAYDFQPSPFPPKYLHPAEDVERILIEIVQAGELPTWLEWELR